MMFLSSLLPRVGLLLSIATIVSGCAGTPAAPYDYAAFKEARPRSILILPATNASPDVHASAGVLAQSIRPLSESGYYVFPLGLVHETFVQNGVTSAADAHALPPERLREIFGADAGLYINVTRYGTSYRLIDSETVVEAQARLVDLRTGTLLWSGEARASSSEDRNSNHNQGLLGLLVSAVINQVISNVADASFPMAGRASARLLWAGRPHGVLYGPRSPKYGSD